MRSRVCAGIVLGVMLVGGSPCLGQPLPGSGCNTIVPGGSAPEASFLYPPGLGSLFHLRESGLVPSTPTWLVLGVAPTVVPLPFGTCVLYVSPLVVLRAGLSSANGFGKQIFGVPADVALLGGTVYFQAFQYTGPTTWALTNGVGATIETPCGFTGATFASQSVVVPLGTPGLTASVTLTGSVAVTSTGDATGSVTASFSGGSSTIALSPSTIAISTAGVTLDLCVSACPDSVVLVNGVATPIESLLGAYASDASVFGSSTGSWTPQSQSLLALMALMNTDPMKQNICAAQGNGLDAGFWCKAACTAMAGAAKLLLLAGCFAPCIGGAPSFVLGGVTAIACAGWFHFCNIATSTAGGVIYALLVEYVWG